MQVNTKMMLAYHENMDSKQQAKRNGKLEETGPAICNLVERLFLNKIFFHVNLQLLFSKHK